MPENQPGDVVEPAEITGELVDSIRANTGLLRTTIVDLLSKGWTYKTELNKTPIWVYPMAQTLV
jgi:hypothetical protein